MIAAASCNQVFDIRETDPADDVLDLDADSIEDAVDNCPEVPNKDQLDGDVDQIGNACDLCPATASDDQHDEDHDGIGDVCDVCPALRDFGDDADDDSVGDLCERDSLPSVRAYFDSFVTLRPEVRPGMVPWVAADDEIAPMSILPATDQGLRIIGAVLGRTWSIRTSTRSLTRWGEGEWFGLRVRDMVTGQIAAACVVFCNNTSSCEASLVGTSASQYTQTVAAAAAVPEVELSLFQSYDSATGKTVYACLLRPLPTLKLVVTGVPPQAVTPELLGSPNFHFKNVDILQ